MKCPAHARSSGSLRLVIVDDEPASRFAVREFFRLKTPLQISAEYATVAQAEARVCNLRERQVAWLRE